MNDNMEEADRLARLRDLMVLDSAPEPVFDSIVAMASEICGVPIALLSLVDSERQWFKANVGLPGINETPRDVAFCAHAIADDALFEVGDATQDPRFSGNALVTGHPDIRFYAGVPLVLPGGERVGTLCVIDREARQLEPAQKRMLRSLAKIATEALLARRDLIQRAVSVRSDYERALAESEFRYRAMVEEQVELVSLSRADGTLVFVNAAYARQFNKTPAQMMGMSFYEFVDSNDRAFVAEQVAVVMHTGVSQSNENRMRGPDGDVHWMAWTNGLQLDEKGARLLHSVGRDITDRYLAEQALQTSQAALARTGRIAGVGGWQLDLATNALSWSEQTRRIHEVPPEFVPSLDSAVAFYAPDVQAAVAAAVQRAMDDGTPWDLELPLVTARGRHIWVRAQGEVELENGVPARLAGAFQDVSERRQLLQRLADNERFVRQVTDALPLRISYLDSDLRFQFVNRAHCERFERPREQILGHTLAELTGRGNAPIVLARVLAALGGEPQHFEYDEESGGSVRRFDAEFLPDIADDGRVRGFYATGIDITERSAAERALRELTDINDNTIDLVVQTDWRGDISYLNPAARAFMGIAAEQPLDRLNFASFNTEQTNRYFADVIVPLVKTQGHWIGESYCYAADGSEVPVSQIVIAHRGTDGRVARYSAILRDISEQRRDQLQLARQAAILRSVTEAIPASIAVIGRDQCYQFVNKAFERWVGASREDLIGRSVAQVMGSQDDQRSRPWAERALAGESVQFERDYDRPGRASHISVSYIPMRMDDGSIDGFVGVMQDISHHKQEEVRLLQLSHRDALTGLLNRGGFEQQMEHMVAIGAGNTLALLYVDLDHFKAVNDQYGHPAGDQVLRLFAQRISALVRPSDAVARLGGDEFAILLSGVRDGADAQRVADKVIDATLAPFDVEGNILRIGASVGVALGVQPHAGWSDLVARADAMLYEAKNAGRGHQAGAG